RSLSACSSPLTCGSGCGGIRRSCARPSDPVDAERGLDGSRSKRAAMGVPYPAGVRDSQWKPTSLRWNIIVPWSVLTVSTGRLPGEHLVGLAETTGPVLVFVIAMTIVAELASVAGVF